MINRYLVDFEFPDEYALLNVVPEYSKGPRYIAETGRNSISLSWEMADDPVSLSVSLESISEIEYYQNKLFLGGLFTGLGIPLTFQGIFEFVNLIVEWARSKTLYAKKDVKVL